MTRLSKPHALAAAGTRDRGSRPGWRFPRCGATG